MSKCLIEDNYILQGAFLEDEGEYTTNNNEDLFLYVTDLQLNEKDPQYDDWIRAIESDIKNGKI